MTGAVSIAGIFLPWILVLAIGAIVLTGLVSRVLASSGAYCFVTYRPLVDVALFCLLLGLLSLLTGQFGLS